MATEHILRRHVTDASAVLWERGWVANHDGNVSAMASPGRIVATPTGRSKRDIGIDDLLIIDESKRVVRGRARIFSEVGLHLKVYAQRPDVGAVIHAHCPYGTAYGLSRESALPAFLPEAVVSLGHEVPVVPLTMPGPDSEAALEPFVDAYDVVFIAGNGVLSWGVDVEQALLRMELAEHLAHIASIQNGVRPLPSEMVDKLLRKRAAAGLGPEGRQP